jgi:heptosyltransferase-1
MKILVVKLSSLGDIIHTFPAITDLSKQNLQLECHWLVEEAFADVPLCHPLVTKIIPIALRRWRKHPLKALKNREIQKAYKQLRAQHYDAIIDAQGLVKSGIMSLLARGYRHGLDRASAREKGAHFYYQQRHHVSRQQHAVTRSRKLFAQALNYPTPSHRPDYGLKVPHLKAEFNHDLMFIPNTTWPTKHWPESYWEKLLSLACEAGYRIHLPWGNAKEYARAKRLAAASEQIKILPRLNIPQLMEIIVSVKGIVAVDTGLSHLAAALKAPTLTIYGPTDPTLAGTLGDNQKHARAYFSCAPCLQKHCSYRGPKPVEPPCYTSVKADFVWDKFKQLLATYETH